MNKFKLLYFALLPLFIACGDNGTDTPEPAANLATINISSSSIVEGAGASMLQFEVKATEVLTASVDVEYTVKGLTATPGTDFTEPASSISIAAGSNSAMISIPIIDDEINEVEEKILVTLMSASNATIGTALATGIIKDNDEPSNFDAEGYVTPNEYFGYNLSWADEFSGDALNTDNYNYELGDGCPNLCGWGNNELEWYTDDEENIHVADGKLVITATKLGTQGYRSGKVNTHGKKEFKFGRIDVRAKLPEGRGIWPAIWMLGSNINDVGWPACGEIDIMEMVGHLPKVSHGTAHWGNSGDPSTHVGSSISLEEKYSEQFHVFTLVWEQNEIKWYMDETHFHTINLANMQGATYRFNAPFHLIFNVAVGGRWPGNPDASTVFPQKMEIDYVRVFQ